MHSKIDSIATKPSHVFVICDQIITTVIKFNVSVNVIGQEKSSERIDMHFIFQ